MSINKKMAVFVVALVTIPMIILLFASTFVLNEQIRRSEQSYLENALKIARNEMLKRKEEVIYATQMLGQNKMFKEALKTRNKAEIMQHLKDLNNVYEYIDIAAVIDAEQIPLVLVPEDMKWFAPWDINGLVAKAEVRQEAVASEEIILLDSFFDPESSEYNKYKVAIVDNQTNNKFLTKALMGVVVTPIYEYHKLKQNLLGFIVFADITNNDDYFPSYYSKSVKGSYLAISVDGIRTTSSIQTPKKTNYVGSRMPLAMESLEGYKYYYFGRINIDDEIHVFLDEPIVDSTGNVVAVLGVGIPEDRFSAILSINHKIIFFVTITCLCFMLIIGRYFSLRITNPIVMATKLAERLGRGEREIVVPDSLLKDKESETTTLLRTFQKMASDLKHTENERRLYFEKLKEEHARQQKLAQQLRILNDELETKVIARTQDLQQAIYALKKADQVKSQFLANMSHELRTPLNAIICCSEVLKDGIMGQLTEKQEKYITNILNSGTHLLQLINDILDISKIEAGKMKLNLSRFYIASVITQAFTIVKSIAYRKNIDVTINIEPSDFEVVADAYKIKQILYNLISNAVKFTSDFGKVEVNVYAREEFMQISVKDNGIGIKEEDQERVFLEFEQVDASYGRQYEGTGLGLPLTRKLVEMHGGEIHLKSKPDVGTEVFVTIPIDTEKFLNSTSTAVRGHI